MHSMINREFQTASLEDNTIENLTKKLMDANTRLAQLQQERESMLANISHDLRAPITAIRGAIDLIGSSEAPSAEDMKRTIALIDRRTRTLEALINDMYYLFTVEDSSRTPETEAINAAAFLEEYFYDAAADPKYDIFDLQLDVPSDLDCIIEVDVQKMVRVLDNLFTNAAKYAIAPGDTDEADTKTSTPEKNKTGSSTPVLRLSACKCESTIKITVSDNGNGISPEVLPYIFTRTYTVSDARTPNSQRSGSGLGLSIAKAIVEKHNGSISCESTPGKGTAFTIELPRKM